MSRRQANDGKNASTQGAHRAAFTARLHKILQHWPSADRLARAMAVSPSAFRKWLRGEAEPSRERLVALADAAKVSIAWLAKGEGPEPIFEPAAPANGRTRPPSAHGGVDASQFLVLPTQPEDVATGLEPRALAAPTNGYIAFRHDWVRSALQRDPASLMLEIAVGESMQPTICEGDLLLVDTTERTCGNFGIYVLDIRGERLVKRVQRKLDGTLVLISDNDTYEPDQVPPERMQDVAVIGRVVWGGGAM